MMLQRKKDYKYYCRACKVRYNREQGRKLRELKKKRPREFWNTFKHKSSDETSEISLQEFYDHFRSLASNTNTHENNDIREFLNSFETDNTENTCTYEELDEPITQLEIKNATKQLKTNKSCSTDCIINEYLIECMDILVKPCEMLFNYILDTRSFPVQWSKGVVVPIYKKGDTGDPNNYRGITLVSCFGKLFTHVINNRLKRWAVDNEVISDAQFGFKSDYSTVDAIYILQSLIERKIRERKKLYCAFVDLKRAFDSIYRDGLWFKLIKSGIDGKLLSIIRSMYSEAKSCVKQFGTLSEFFSSDVGLLQGEVISPILFSLFLNDIEMSLQSNASAGVTLEQLSLYLLMFADDAVFFSESIEGLQSLLDNLEQYCKKWDLTVNTDKTKVVIFRKGGVVSQEEKWTYDNKEIEIVSSFNYLGVVLSSGGSFAKATSTLSGKALKAVHSLFAITKDKEIPLDLMFGLFDTFVGSILSYGCEIWGFSRADNIERIHKKFCKWLINVKSSTNDLSLYGELGRYPLIIGREIRIIKYWLKLHSIKSNNCILWAVISTQRNEIDFNVNVVNWVSKIKNLLERIGFPDIWMFPSSVNIDKFIAILRVRLRDLYISQWREGMHFRTSLILYRELKSTFETSFYLLKMNNRKYRNTLAKFRLSSHCLAIETGRHRNIERSARKCNFCTLDEIEDEYHFVLICPYYNDLRRIYIKRYFYTRPSMYKFINLLNTTKLKDLNNLAKFLINAFKLRENLVVTS